MDLKLKSSAGVRVISRDKNTSDENMGAEHDLQWMLINLHKYITLQEEQLLTALRNLDDFHWLSSDSLRERPQQMSMKIR